mgnify:FL=1
MKEQVKNFLNTTLTETEYYSLPKENLITLKEYLLQLKDKDNIFKTAIQEQFQSIKKKCVWLNAISFGGLINESGNYVITAIYLYSKDGIDLIANYNHLSDRYEDLTKNVPKVYLLSGKVRKHLSRQKDIDLIQEELREIENVGRNIYIDVLRPISSISNNFQIYYTPDVGLSIYNEDDLIADYLNCSKKSKEKEYLKEEDSKEKLLRRILVKPNKNN